ncbi:MAG: hypothetical protein UY16_C0021G0018 [Candidatus Gottesmanbacteria bacterium GW2011_GWA2_47_9]|uniref:Uncharacterized protein n=1 Tax=Candidatus Gottesmanbacteria bacterium GW2011_GWA2_47_9 TaxID=1618445 RepID=A0A0G1WBH5_9BACT|nr:MAG: hypothetical protein UY16_C0021G0018 [Candidatus Gottesmanbacteria bacterium GW2011_GWA2_47_9]
MSYKVQPLKALSRELKFATTSIASIAFLIVFDIMSLTKL